MFRIFGIIIPGVSSKNTNGSSETLIFVCKALVIPGLAPTFIGFPLIFNVPLRIKLINDDLPTLGIPQISKFESGENFLLNLSDFCKGHFLSEDSCLTKRPNGKTELFFSCHRLCPALAFLTSKSFYNYC